MNDQTIDPNTQGESVTADSSRQTYGERLVGLSFNPSGDPRVHNAKAAYASLIDDADTLRNESEDPEVKRMASITITELQTAQMWHVKALTWK